MNIKPASSGAMSGVETGVTDARDVKCTARSHGDVGSRHQAPAPGAALASNPVRNHVTEPAASSFFAVWACPFDEWNGEVFGHCFNR